MFDEEDACEFMHTFRLDLDRRVLDRICIGEYRRVLDRMQMGSASPARHREMMSLQFLMG